jgi:hypothetical protein
MKKQTKAPGPEAVPAAAGAPKKRRVQTRSIDKQRIFLRCYEKCGSIMMALAAVPMDQRMHYRWLKADPEYAREFQEAKEIATQTVEDEAVERAMRGVFEPYIYQGAYCYPQEEYVIKPAVVSKRGQVIKPEVRGKRDIPGAAPMGLWKKSDYLLAKLLTGMMREKYGAPRSLEISGPGGGAIDIAERMQAAASGTGGSRREQCSLKDAV